MACNLKESRILKKYILKTPAVVLINPKIMSNLAGALRACACFGIKQLIYTGDRIQWDKDRLPREFRLRDYMGTEVIHDDNFLIKTSGVRKVAVEFLETAQNLVDFQHSSEYDCIYVLGPEDGNIPSNVLRECESFVKIPTKYCINLSASVYIVLYDRHLKMDKETNPWPNII